MGRIKINQYSENKKSGQKSNIKKYLEEEVAFLLDSTTDNLRDVAFDEVYIHNHDVESELIKLLTRGTTDKITFLTGLTGSGKSTIIKYVFRTFTLAPVITDDRKTLIIPITFDNVNGSKDETSIRLFISKMIGAACAKVQKDFSDIPPLTSGIDAERFVEFILTIRADKSVSPTSWMEPSAEETLQSLISDDPLAFYLLKLKYYLRFECCSIDNVVLIFDDIESLGVKKELIPIRCMYEIATCFHNYPQGKRKWGFNILVGCRHYIYRIIRTHRSNGEFKDLGYNAQAFESYSEDEEINLESPPEIIDIVTKRYNAKIKTDTTPKWQTAMNVVMGLVRCIDSELGNMVLSLNHKNIRKSLKTIKQIVFNYRWVQRDYQTDSSGAFIISSIEQYNTSPVNLIRAIGLGEGIFFSAHSEHNIIPNILENNFEDGYELIPLLTLVYFLRAATAGEKYQWHQSIEISEFLKKVKRIFPHDYYSGLFRKAVTKLIMDRLLLRSVNQVQDDGTDLEIENAETIENVYPSSSARVIFEKLESNSILFEMFIDDIFIDRSLIDYLPSIDKKDYIGFDYLNYGLCLDYLDTLITKENIIRNVAFNNNQLGEYVGCFGEQPVVSTLLSGLRKSAYSYFKDEGNLNLKNYKSTFHELNEKIKKMIII